MIQDLRNYLSRSTKGRAMLDEIDTSAQTETRTHRHALAAEIRALRARLEKELPPLVKKRDDAEASLLRAKRAYADAEQRFRDATHEINGLSVQIERDIQARERTLAESADPSFEAFVDELHEGFEAMRSRGEGYLGIRLADYTGEGAGHLLKAFLATRKSAMSMPSDGEIDDPHAAIAAARAGFLATAQELAGQFGRDKERARHTQAVREKLLEEDLAFKRRQGWPEDEIEAYRREQRAAGA